MIAGALTTGFYLLAGLIVWRRENPRVSLLALGTLPFVWITICSLAGLADTLLGLSPLWSLSTIVALVCVAAIACHRVPSSTASRIEISALSAVALLIASGVAVAIGLRVQHLEPWGGWDAMFTWVLRGRFFFAGGDLWSNTFSEDLALLHPDYPPLLGWALHGLWRVDGVESTASIAWLFSPSWPGFVLVMLGWWRTRHPDDRIRVVLPLAVLLVTPLLWKLAASKLSDFLLVNVIAASVGWYCSARRLQDTRGIGIAMFLAAWAGLIKNEGILWFLAFGIVVSASMIRTIDRRSRQIRAALFGIALPGLALVLFKVLLAPPSDLFAPQRPFEIGEIIQPGILINPAPIILRIDQIFDGWRHRMIWQYLGIVIRSFSDWGLSVWLLVLLAVYRLRLPGQCSPLLIAVFIQAAGYYLVYLMTPYHPYWHLSTSLSRLMAHVLPAAMGLLAIETPSTRPNSSSAIPAGWTAVSAWLAATCLVVMPLLNLRALNRGDWKVGEQPGVDLTAKAAIGFPDAPSASYVTTHLGARDLYATQFESVPTVLLVDRRKQILLARFQSGDELYTYCDGNGWRLHQNSDGFGWASDAGGDGLRQPVTVERIE